jgi:hypothetical protein
MHDRTKPTGFGEEGQATLDAAQSYGKAPREIGEAWLRDNAVLIAAYFPGTVIAINTGTGEHVSASDGLAAMDLFEERFGAGAIAWVHEIGVPITVGSGYCGLYSGV